MPRVSHTSSHSVHKADHHHHHLRKTTGHRSDKKVKRAAHHQFHAQSHDHHVHRGRNQAVPHSRPMQEAPTTLRDLTFQAFNVHDSTELREKIYEELGVHPSNKEQERVLELGSNAMCNLLEQLTEDDLEDLDANEFGKKFVNTIINEMNKEAGKTPIDPKLRQYFSEYFHDLFINSDYVKEQAKADCEEMGMSQKDAVDIATEILTATALNTYRNDELKQLHAIYVTMDQKILKERDRKIFEFDCKYQSARFTIDQVEQLKAHILDGEEIEDEQIKNYMNECSEVENKYPQYKNKFTEIWKIDLGVNQRIAISLDRCGDLLDQLAEIE